MWNFRASKEQSARMNSARRECAIALCLRVAQHDTAMNPLCEGADATTKQRDADAGEWHNQPAEGSATRDCHSRVDPASPRRRRSGVAKTSRALSRILAASGALPRYGAATSSRRWLGHSAGNDAARRPEYQAV